MAGSFFTQSWYRVAGLKPRLADHIDVTRHRYAGQAWYALSDPVSGRVHRLTPQAYLFAARMDGKRTIDAIWQDMVGELDTEAPGQEDIVQLLMQLHSSDLLVGDIPPDAGEMLLRRNRQQRSLWLRNLCSPLSMQFPLIDPDRFLTRTMPLLRPFLGWVGLVAWLLLVLTGLVIAGEHWKELSANLLDRVMAAEGLLVLGLCYPIVKALHELGHGYAAKRFGCEIREMGVMLLVFFPVPYVDASASSALPSKWQRAAVAAAGIMVELALAAIAAIVWAEAEPGVLRAVAFNVMLIGGVSTVVVNGNPLLRFDGYYVLTDVLEMPNLQQRSTRFMGYLVNRHIFRVPLLPTLPANLYERAVMFIYAPTSFVYRILVMVGVSLFVAGHYFVVGVAMAVVTTVMALLWPAAKALWKVATGLQYRVCRGRAVGFTFGAIAAVVAGALFIPAPVHSNAEGVIWLPQEAMVRAGADGFVSRVVVQPGAMVAKGDVLFRLSHPIAEAKLRVVAARVDELAAKYAAEWVTDRIAAAVTGFELNQARATLAREKVRISDETVRAPSDGRFNPSKPATDFVGSYVKLGELVGYVTPPAGAVARVLVPQGDIGLVQSRLRRVEVRLADRHTDLPSSLLRAVPAADDTLPSAALASDNGGSVFTDPRFQQGPKAFERHFQFDVTLPEGEMAVAESGFGARVFVRFDYAWEPVGAALYRRVRQGMLSRFET